MNALTVAAQLAGGFLLLLFGGDWLVDGGVAIARRFRISPLVIGLTIVAFGTSAPELLVSVTSALKGNAGIAIGNVVGSNIVNIGLILGLTALICPIVVETKSVTGNWLVMFFASLLLMLFSLGGEISRLEGAILFAGLLAYTWLSIRMGRRSGAGSDDDGKSPMRTLPAILLVMLSCVMLAYGADLLVDGATTLARAIGVSDRVIGLTLVAFGTSLPELAASLAAAFKKQMDISIGNIIGSNIFNIMSVLGLSAAVTPIRFDPGNYMRDFVVMLVFSVALLLFISPWRKNGRLSRTAGLILFFGYAAYAYFLF